MSWETHNIFKNTVKVHSVDEYFALPKKDRVKWGFWYLKPFSLPCDMFDSTVVGWQEFDNRIKKEFPIQYMIREFFSDIDAKIWRIKYKLDNWWIRNFDPQHQELRDAVPKNWADLDTCIENFLYACIISYVEKENGLGNYYNLRDDKVKYDEFIKTNDKKLEDEVANNWGSVDLFKNYYDDNFEFYQKLNEIYHYAKVKRPAYLEFYNSCGEVMLDFDGSEVTWDQIEEIMKKKDDLYLAAIVKYRGRLWT